MPHDQSERLHALDAVRALALLLGIVLHASMAFLPGPQIWVTQDIAAAPGFSLAFLVPHIFRLTLFFFIAGYFGRMAIGKRGFGGFLGDRAKRIALPLVVFWGPLFAGITAAFIWGFLKANGGVVPEGTPPPPPLELATLPLTHLWFLYLLILFYIPAALLHLIARLAGRMTGLPNRLDQMLALALRTPLGLVLLAAPIGLWFWFSPAWYAWFGIPTPDTGFVPNTGALIAYGVAFGAGWMVQGQSGLLQAWRRWWPVNIALALAATGYCVHKLGLTPDFIPATAGNGKASLAAAYALASWAWTLGITGMALQFWSGHSKVRRYIADSSYWLYLMHLPLVMALQVVLSDLAWPGPVKFALVLAITLIVLLGSYQLLVRYSWLGAWLNGRRARPGAAKPSPATVLQPTQP
ncbi:acyltransferase family protein [Maricaulis sp.]|uniref:acyltransferase family protein n=1 Tax=Maricaulis sp. TaxID=1486257 RepID=UPI003A92FE1B